LVLRATSFAQDAKQTAITSINLSSLLFCSQTIVLSFTLRSTVPLFFVAHPISGVILATKKQKRSQAQL
jgi:surface polysaccharide O-acyltransferase-like enzyme